MQDIIGKRFGRLKVLELAGTNISRQQLYLVECDCGNHKRMTIYVLKAPVKGIKTCKACNYAAIYPKEYAAWMRMNSRCYNPNRENYKYYGGRGITVCEEWRNDFLSFYEYIGPAPSAKHSVEREDNNGNYEPGNVCWATQLEQIHNRRI